MHHRIAIVCITAFLALPICADINFTVKKDGATDKATAPELANNELPRVSHTVKLQCDNTVNTCAGITVEYKGRAVCQVAAGATSCSGTIAAADLKSGELLVVKRGAETLFSGAVTIPGEAADTNGSKDLSTLLGTPCDDEIAAHVASLDLDSATLNPAASSTYLRRRNEATFVVDVLGNVLAAPTENVDENDTVVVRVFADRRLHHLLKVRRKSAIRVLTNRIVGGGGAFKVPLDQLAQSVRDGGCGFKEFVLKDFNPNRGEVEISVQNGAQSQALGTFDFVVDALYNGMFSLGPATSDLTDRAFKLQTKDDGKKIIYSTEEGDTTRYAVFFTPFLRARDIEKSGQPFWEHINPTFGISTEETGSNAYAGISIDYKGFVVSGGWHFSRINDLASGSGLAEGSVFSGAEADIPQAKRWENDKFIAISIDLRSAVELFQTLVTGGGGGGS